MHLDMRNSKGFYIFIYIYICVNVVQLSFTFRFSEEECPGHLYNRLNPSYTFRYRMKEMLSFLVRIYSYNVQRGGASFLIL